MIQRIQSIYLFFAFCLMAVLVLLPFSSSLIILIGSGAAALLSIINIFLYKKRSLQRKICYVILFLSVLVYIIYFSLEYQNFSLSEIKFTFIFPLIAIIFTYLAIRGIKKDEKLIRSLDRLR